LSASTEKLTITAERDNGGRGAFLDVGHALSRIGAVQGLEGMGYSAIAIFRTPSRW